MALPNFVIPDDPLRRFSDLYLALLEGRPWWQGKSQLRYAALALTALPGEPHALAAKLDAVADELQKKTPWYQRSPIGTMIASLLLVHGDPVTDFLAETERAKALFRDRWSFHGRTAEMLAILVLRQDAPDGKVTPAMVAKLAAIYEELRTDHPWITNSNDWPACALLSRSERSPRDIAARVESLYQALHEEGFQRGNALQTATQILWFHEAQPAALARRFRELYAAFEAAGLWMSSTDYDEIAELCFAPQPAPEVLAAVKRHRDHILALPARPDRQTSFTLAVGTALLDLLRASAVAKVLNEAQMLVLVQTLLAAQHAAAAAAASSAAAAAS